MPTAELKKILSDRFAQQVSSATRAKLLRAFTFLGLPGILAAGGVLWKVLDNEVARKVSDSREALASKVATDLDRGLGSLRRDLEAYTKEQVATAFTGRYGEALHDQLRAAMAAQSFQREMRSRISNEVTEVWTRDKERLRKSFLEVLTADKRFLEKFSQEVAGAMGQSDAVPAIIAKALAESVRDAKPGEAGRATAALSLLAAVDQGRANAVVRDLLDGAARPLPEDEGGRQGRREMALQGLQHVGFGGSGAALAEGATGMLAAALAAWAAHCAAVPCGGAEHAPARALEAFLARGRDLPDAESDAWVVALALWHEELLRGDGRARRASLHLVPRALGAIGTDEALKTLVRWFTSGESNLALSAAEALGSRAAWHLDDAKRLALFKDLWPKGTTAEARRALLAEAEWMALGRVSDGRADPAGAYRPEASLVRARPPLTAGRPPIARWAAARPAAFERQRGLLPPAEPCALGTGAASQRRAELCALAALIRPDRGGAEWSELRGVTLWDEDEVAVLGLLWTVAASRAAEGASGVEGRLAPLPDLLRPRSPAPAGWRLAAMLLLRTAPEQAAWQALRQLRPSLADAPVFAAASRWLFRPWAVSQAWFVEELGQLPPDLRSAVAREVVALALPPDEADADDPVPAVIRRLSSPGVAALNALSFAHASDPDAVLAAVERENGFRALEDAAAGGASGGGVQAGVARELFDALMNRAGWPQAVIAASQEAGAATAPPRVGPRTPLVPSVQGRFGRLRLAGGDTLALAPAEAGKNSGALPPVAFHNPATRETRVLGPGDTWVLPGYAEEEWMFRLRADGAPAVQLAATPPETLAPAAAASAADLPVVEEGRVYTVGPLPNGPEGAAGESGEVAGWARTPGLRADERMRISTFDLADDVDTLVELRRPGATAPLHRNDDSGDGLASRLDWTVDRDGEVLIRLVHIGAPGAFRLRLERLGRAPQAEAAAVGGGPGAARDASAAAFAGSGPR